MMRALATVIGVVAALILIGVSAAMNITFLSSLGRNQTEALILGAASGAADGLKALLPVFAVWGWQNKRRVFVVPAICVWALFVGFSLLSAFGFAASIRTENTERQDKLNAQLISVQDDIAKAQNALAAIPQHRPAPTIEAELNVAKQNIRWASTKGCSDATLPESRTFCTQYFKLQGELATARKADEIQAALNDVKERKQRLIQQGAGQSSDPQSQLLANLIGVSDHHIRLGLMIVLSVIVELGSSLGLFLATGHSEIFKKPVSQAANNNEPDPLLIHARPLCMVEDWALARLIPMPGACLKFKDAYADYETLCTNADLEALNQENFITQLKNIADKIGLKQSEYSFRDVALSALTVSSQAA